MGFFKPKSCCGFLTLGKGVTILLLIAIIGSIYNLYIFGYSYSNTNSYSYSYLNSNLERLRYIYIIKSIICIVFSFIGMMGIYYHKASFIRFYVYYLIVDLIFTMAVIFIFLVPFIFYKSYMTTFIISLTDCFLELYSIFIFNSYGDQLREEKKEKNYSTVIFTV